ncbi:MAG: hypothetical protein FJ279_02335 [Planctomycetes bacterium]|nr:hypothetical protein [Planctomycetota bacterium]
MALVLETWQAFSLHQDVRLEERITAVFRDVLIAAYSAAGRSWFIVLEDPVTDPTFGTEMGRNDLRFYPPQHHGQTIYFTVECKRLHVTTGSGFKHQADKYVTEGLQRFVDGKYSAGLPCGGMLGYVMDNRLDDAFARVRSEIKARRAELRMTRRDAFRAPSSVLQSHPRSADTVHARGDGELTIHHLLVGISHSADSPSS